MEPRAQGLLVLPEFLDYPGLLLGNDADQLKNYPQR